MFIDEASVVVKAGDGGDGCCAFERSRARPAGRPSGGTGGRGGHIYVRGSHQLHTLQDCSYRKHYRSDRGVHGKGAGWTGSNGEDIYIDVPLGTIVRDNVTGRILFDCVRHGHTHLVARGGRGGRGNKVLISKTDPFPQHAEKGEQGEQRHLQLTLKVLADVGLVGRPNAGKSTFLSRISRAQPKIADYPFTTTEPHLGIVRFADGADSMVVADIPGLIEDSHEGKGLGIRFLKHIERTKILAVLVECTSEDPRADADVLVKELTAYSEVLARKPMCFVLTKTDLLTGRKRKPPKGWLAMSAVSGDGLDEVLAQLRRMYAALPSDDPGEQASK